MNDAMNDTQRDIQDLQRDMRGVQRDLRHNDADTRELNAQLEQLNAELKPLMAKLDEQQKTYRDYMDDYRKQVREQEESFNEDMSKHLFQSLCDYGSTLKSLKDDEHVTLIFEDYKDNRDQVYVFPFKEVESCKSVDKLTQAAISYQM